MVNNNGENMLSEAQTEILHTQSIVAIIFFIAIIILIATSRYLDSKTDRDWETDNIFSPLLFTIIW